MGKSTELQRSTHKQHRRTSGLTLPTVLLTNQNCFHKRYSQTTPKVQKDC